MRCCGAAYLKRYLRPATLTGVDLVTNAVAFCQRYHRKLALIKQKAPPLIGWKMATQWPSSILHPPSSILHPQHCLVFTFYLLPLLAPQRPPQPLHPSTNLLPVHCGVAEQQTCAPGVGDRIRGKRRGLDAIRCRLTRYRPIV